MRSLWLRRKPLSVCNYTRLCSRMASFETANEYLRDLERVRRNQEAVITRINKFHSRLQKTICREVEVNAQYLISLSICQSPDVAEKYGEKLWVKLRDLYIEAKSYADEEDRVSTALIGQLDSLIAPGTHRKKSDGGEQKRKRKAESDVSRLSSPSISHRSPCEPAIALGDQVAARVSDDNAEKDDWIVVKVIRFDRESNKLEVIDEEPGDDEESVQRKYKLPYSCIIPFPKASDPSTAPEFTLGNHVLAVYPGTTALYKATVAATRKRKTDEYVLEFDDDEEEGVDGLPQRQVPFYQVVQLPEGHRQ